MGKRSTSPSPARPPPPAPAASTAASESAAATAWSREDRFPVLSGLRGLAALGVFLLHGYALAGSPRIVPGSPTASFLLAWPLRMGWAGVDVFFTLSAFLLALPFVRAQQGGTAPPSLSAYAARRALRIFPAYATQLLLLYLLIALGLSGGIVVQHVTAARLLVQPVFGYDLGWMSGLPMQWPLVGTWWTMPVEVGFYLVLPWMVRLLRPGRWPWLLLAIALAWSWRALLLWNFPYTPPVVYLAEHLPGRIDQFAIGMLAAYAFCRAPRVLAWIEGRRADLLFLVSLLVFLALPALGYVQGKPVGEYPPTHPLLIGWHTYASVAVAGMLIAAARRAPAVTRIVGALPFRVLGHISYGLYLWHLPILMWMHAEGGVALTGGALLFVGDGLLLSIVAALLSWRLVERRAMRLAARWPRARMAAPVPANPA